MPGTVPSAHHPWIHTILPGALCRYCHHLHFPDESWKVGQITTSRRDRAFKNISKISIPGSKVLSSAMPLGNASVGGISFFLIFFFKSSPHLAWDYVVSVDEGIRCHFNHLGHRNPKQFTFSIPENNLLFQSSLWFVLEGKNLSTKWIGITFHWFIDLTVPSTWILHKYFNDTKIE